MAIFCGWEVGKILRFNHGKAFCNQLLNEVQIISESYKRVAEATGENFNIFSILQVGTSELTTHSRFIAELLNPKGSHGRANAFLKCFAEYFKIENFEPSMLVEVLVEFYIGRIQDTNGGRIDILINDQKGGVILIENKIYAREQKNQLSRYLNENKDGNLFFLTLYGVESEEHRSINYTAISYKTDIIEWL